MADEIIDPTLQDPYAEQETKYGWDEDFQRHIIARLVADRQFLLQSLDLIRPSYFTNKAHVKLSEIVRKFFKEYRVLPRKDFVVQELKTAFKDNKSLSYYLAEVNVVYDYFQPGLEARDYLSDKITYFAKIQSLKKAFKDSLSLIEKNPECEETWNEIYDKMKESMTTHTNFEVGTDYFKTLKDRYAAMAEEQTNRDVFTTSWAGIDAELQGGGFGRGEIFSVVAGSGVGKSLALARIITANILRGKRCLYVTLEMAEPKIAGRMDAIFSGLPIQTLFGNQDELFKKLATLDNVNLEGDIWPLVIKQFPAGTLTVNGLKAYFSQLRFHGFPPDMAVIDYVGEMKDDPGMKLHDSREKIVRDLRGMATEENIFMATAMQPNRQYKVEQKGKGERSRIDDEHLGDSYGQIRPLDGCLSINQNDTEKLLGIARGFVIKLRDAKSRYWVYFGIDQQNLRITEISHREYMEKLNAHKEYVSDETQIDNIADKGWKPEEKKDENSGEESSST